MPAASLPATTRFFTPGVTACYFVPAVASTSGAITRAEINAGTSLAPQIAEASGWMVQSNLIATPDLASTFTSQIGGRTTADQSSITFYGTKTGVDVRGVLYRGVSGYIVWADGGDVSGSKADVFPVQVTSLGKPHGNTGDDAFKLTISFAITSQPFEDIALPA